VAVILQFLPNTNQILLLRVCKCCLLYHCAVARIEIHSIYDLFDTFDHVSDLASSPPDCLSDDQHLFLVLVFLLNLG
jgi:hypothetical protein